MMSCNRSSMRNLIQNVLERSSKIGRTWVGLNDNELWLSKDDNDTTSNVKLQKKKNLQRSSEDGWSCTASFEWMWWSTPTLVDYNRSDNRLGFPWRKKTCHREKKVFVRRAMGQYYFLKHVGWLTCWTKIHQLRKLLTVDLHRVYHNIKNNILYLLYWKILAWFTTTKAIYINTSFFPGTSQNIIGSSQ